MTMRKPLLIIAASSLISGLSVTEAEAIEPNFPCFMKNSSGRVINLSQLCSSQSVTIPSTSSARSKQEVSSKDYLVSQGRGGYEDKNGVAYEFYYELWSRLDNTRYTLKVWKFDDYPNRSTPWTRSFQSSSEALNHFDCFYSRKSLPTCLR